MRIAKSVFFLFLLLLVAGFIFSITLGYSSTLDFLVSCFHQQQHRENIAGLLTAGKFKLLQRLAIAIILILSGVLYYFNDIYRSISYAVVALLKTLQHNLLIVFRSEGKYALMVPLLASVYFALVMPVSYDEAWTFLNFTSNGPLVSVSYYPAPNNHILHSLLTNVSNWLPLESLLCMRIPVIFVHLLNWCIVYAFLKKQFGSRMALVTVSIASMLFMSIYYSFMSRGYGLLCLFFACAFYAAFRIASKQADRRDWHIYVIASVLGFYTMPSFLYPLMTMNAFILFSDIRIFGKLCVANLFIFIAAGLLYLPVIIVSGAAAIVNNTYVAPLPRTQVIKELPGFFTNAVEEITGLNAWIVLVLITGSLILQLLRKDKYLLLCGTLLILPFALLLIHSVIPFSRTFVYYAFLLPFIIFIPFRHELHHIKPLYLWSLLILIQCGLLVHFYRKVTTYEAYNITSHQVIQQIAGNKKYVCNDRLFDALLLFELKTKAYRDYQFRYYNCVDISADTITGSDFTIVAKQVDKTLHAKPRIITKYYTVY
jgi:hypothetical protein